jgi:hypothetical protein
MDSLSVLHGFIDLFFQKGSKKFAANILGGRVDDKREVT